MLGPYYSICCNSFVTKVTKFLVEASDSSIVMSAIGAFGGAMGAAYGIYLISRRKEDEAALQEINTVTALLSGHINTLIRLKVDCVHPFKEGVESFKESALSKKKVSNTALTDTDIIELGDSLPVLTRYFHEIVTRMDIPVSVLGKYAHISTRPIEHVSISSEIFNTIAYKIRHRNTELQRLRKSDDLIASYYQNLLLELDRVEQPTDEQVIEGDVEAGICYMLESTRRLQVVAKEILPKSLHDKIAEYRAEAEVRNLLPTQEVINKVIYGKV